MLYAFVGCLKYLGFNILFVQIYSIQCPTTAISSLSAQLITLFMPTRTNKIALVVFTLS